MNWGQLKYRWSLTIDSSEKSVLTHDLADNGCGEQTIEAPAVNIAPTAPTPPASSTTLYLTKYDGTIWTVSNWSATPITYPQWRDEYAFQAPVAAPTNYVRYTWSPTLYAVTFWPGSDSSQWTWHRLTYVEWQHAGSPNARAAGYITGSSYYQWSTGSDVFVQGEDGSLRNMS